MKKVISLLLVFILCFSLVACGSKSTDSQDAEETKANSQENSGEEPEATSQTAIATYNFGDTITTSDKMFEFTPVFEGFTDKLANWPDKNYMTPEGRFSGNTPYEAAEDKVMMYFSGTIKYIGESKSNVTFTYNFTIDYDNGYLFEFAGGNALNSGKGYHSGCGITNDILSGDWKYKPSATFEPLSSDKTRYVRFCIEVPNQLEENTEKILTTFTINGEKFNFNIVK